MSDFHHIGRRPVLAGIGTAAVAAFQPCTAPRSGA